MIIVDNLINGSEIMCEEVKIQITDEIEKIMCQNLTEKAEAHTVKFESCEDCWYYDKPWIRGDRLHCCAYTFEDVKTSREINDLYDDLIKMGVDGTETCKFINNTCIIDYYK